MSRLLTDIELEEVYDKVKWKLGTFYERPNLRAVAEAQDAKTHLADMVDQEIATQQAYETGIGVGESKALKVVGLFLKAATKPLKPQPLSEQKGEHNEQERDKV